jgi:hypothetical protein
MRIDKIYLQSHQRKIFYEEFRKLYGKFIQDYEIDSILEHNEFVLTTEVTSLFKLVETDYLTEDTEDYFISIKNGDFKKRFKVVVIPIPDKSGKINFVIDGYKALSHISREDIFIEAFEFLINTSLEDASDLNLTLDSLETTNNSDQVLKIIDYLNGLISRNDIKKEKAITLLNEYKDLLSENNDV